MVSYNNEFQKGFNICGQPSSELVEFFKHYQKEHESVLDLGCGQGRDALFIARKGHTLLGVDSAQTSIKQMLKLAVRENLNVNGIVADIIDFEADDVYDVVLIVRVLLILQSNKIRKSVLEKYSSAVCNDGYYLIADTPKNQILICNIFKSLKQDLELIKKDSYLPTK